LDKMREAARVLAEAQTGRADVLAQELLGMLR
jgi:hypothetical protein